MKVKVMIAVATAVCLGALSVVVFTKTSVRVQTPPPRAVPTVAPSDGYADANARMHKLFSGATPDPKNRP